jgi:hypothetical protein
VEDKTKLTTLRVQEGANRLNVAFFCPNVVAHEIQEAEIGRITSSRPVLAKSS